MTRNEMGEMLAAKHGVKFVGEVDELTVLSGSVVKVATQGTFALVDFSHQDKDGVDIFEHLGVLKR